MGSPHHKRSQGSQGKGLDHDTPDILGPYNVDAILVLLICAGAVIVVVMVPDGTGIDSANVANVLRPPQT